MNEEKNPFVELREKISNEAKAINELQSLITDMEGGNFDEKDLLISQASSIRKALKKENDEIPRILERITLIRKLDTSEDKKRDVSLGEKKEGERRGFFEDFSRGRELRKKLEVKQFENETLKRIKRHETGEIVKKNIKPSFYVRASNKMFSNFSSYLIGRGLFKNMEENLVKANMELMPKTYVSLIFFATFASFLMSIIIFTFFTFFNIQVFFPFVTQVSENALVRISKIFWILIAFPIGTFLFGYFYPSMEKSSIENKINQELPFAAINMSAISGSMINPTKIFRIIVITKEYPNLEKEFLKVLNGVNVLGYDLITTLKNSANNSPSKKLSDLFNGIATTISSGGDMPKFFNERAASLLFEYNLEKEKSTKAAETFMDIYISVVIAAPMILMLLLIMMQISGLGFSITTFTLTLVMISGVSMINIVFLAFLHLKQSSEA